MGKSTDLRGLQPGGTYQVQIVPKGSDPSDRNGSFVTTFTVPTTDINGAQLSTVHKSLKTVIFNMSNVDVGVGDRKVPIKVSSIF